MMKTINISLPKSMLEAAKNAQKKYHYASMSEIIRDSLRWWMDDRLTRNGFTPKFEEEVLRSSRQPRENDIEWDGKTDFVDFVLGHPQKIHVKSKVQSDVSRATAGTHKRRFKSSRDNPHAHSVVSQ